MVEVSEEYVRLLERAKSERKKVDERTKRRVAELQWKLGEYHGNEQFFAETHVQTNVPLTGGYVEVHAQVSTENLEEIFNRVAEFVEKHDPEETITYYGDPALLHMVLEGSEGGQVHITYVPTRSDDVRTHLSIKGFGNSRDVAKIMRIVAEALRTLNRENLEKFVQMFGERESVR